MRHLIEGFVALRVEGLVVADEVAFDPLAAGEGALDEERVILGEVGRGARGL